MTKREPDVGGGGPEGGSRPGSTEPQLGANSPRGWYRRYLPHCDNPGLIQFITYRLADSLPLEVVRSTIAESLAFPPSGREAKLRQRLEALLDSGLGSCLLSRPEAAGCVVETWKRFAGERYDLIAWVVMPNHVHLMVNTYVGFPLGKIVQSWKSFTGRRLKTLQADTPGSIWMREYWDRYIRDAHHFEATVYYIHQNPVKAGLVASSTDWAWSSAREYSGWASSER